MTSIAIALLLLLSLIIIPTTTAGGGAGAGEIHVMLKEMEQANYFTFVTLLNMVRSNITTNTTFFMPSDRHLSKVVIPEKDVLDFLLRHSVPSPLLFDDLTRLPAGTLLPTDQPNFMLTVSNGGKSDFYLNDIKLTVPDICTSGSSFRCHGIDGVLLSHAPPPPPECMHAAQPPPSPLLPPPPPPPPLPPPPLALLETPPSPSCPTLAPPALVPAISPSPAPATPHEKSSSSRLVQRGMFIAMSVSAMVFLSSFHFDELFF